MKQGAQRLRRVPDGSPQAPAQLRSSQPPPMLGLPPPSSPPADTCRYLFWAREVCDATKHPAAFPQATTNSGSSTSPPQSLLTLKKERSLGAAGHPLTAPLRSSPRPHQASHRPTHAVKFTGRADRVTGQAAGTAGDGGLQEWGRHKGGAGREDPFPVGPHGNRVPRAAVQEVGLPVKAKEEGAIETPPAQEALHSRQREQLVGTSPRDLGSSPVLPQLGS